jgi:hypothetical protein
VLVNEANEIFRSIMQERAGTTFPPGGKQDVGRFAQVPGLEDRSTTGVALQTGATDYANAMLAAPSVAADFLSYPVRRMFGGQDTKYFGATPRLTVEGIASRLPIAGDQRSSEEREAQIGAAQAATEEKYPVATTIGHLGAAAPILTSLRAPFMASQRPRAFEYLAKKKVSQAENVAPLTVAAFRGPTHAKNATKRSQTFVKFMRGTNRVAEAGAEGAALALLQNKDPMEAAAFTAGAQGTLSGITEGVTRKWINFGGAPGKLTGLALQVAGLSYALYALGVAAPGGVKDYEAQHTAAQKVLLGTMIGMATGGFSSRARSGYVSSRAPYLADAFGSAPRNVMQQVIVDQLSKPAADREGLTAKLKLLMENADKISPEGLRNLSAAMSANKDRFLSELDKITKGLGNE